MMRILIALGIALCVAAAFGSSAEAHGKQVRFLGVHPIPKTEGGGICYIEGPHVHIYVTNDKLQYRVHAGANHFVGDPVAYGYDGPKFAYKGPHPIHVDDDTEWCYLEGPHFHAEAPPASPEFKVVGDAYFFVGEPPQVFLDARPTYVKINAVYTPMVYARPTIVVDAPDGWIGARAEFITPVVVAPVVVAPNVGVGVEVVAPSVEVHVPMPSIHIGVGIGGSIGVGGGVIMEERHEERHGDHREHHDNGRHRGHGK